MRIQTKGSVSMSKANSLIKEIVTNILERAELDPKTPFKIQDLNCGIVFKVDGKEQCITVNHGGLEEVFTVAVSLDEKGNIVTENTNENETFIDDYTRAQLLGQEKTYAEIKSEYDDEDLELIDALNIDDTAELTYKVKGEDKQVIRYYKGDKLVGELETKKKGE